MTMLRRSRRSSALYPTTTRSGGAVSHYHIYSCVVSINILTREHKPSNPHFWLPPCHPQQAANSRRDTEYERYEPKQIHNVPHSAPRVYSQGCLKDCRCHTREECRNRRDVEVSRRCSLLLVRKEHRQRWKERYLIVLEYTKTTPWQLTFFTESLQFFCYGTHCFFGASE